MSRLIALLLIVLFFSCDLVPAQDRGVLKIAFNVLQNKIDDDYEVFTANLDGSSMSNVTNHKDVAWTYYSIPGKLLFVSDRNACRRCYFLYESDIDGGNVRKISNLQLEDSWMGSRKGGEELIVSGRIDTRVRFQLFLIDRLTGRFRQLTNEPAAAYRDPSFSPDGRQIIFVYKKDRTDRSEFEELYIMNADSSDLRKLTTYPKDDPLDKDLGYKVGPPHWNSKHGFISYQSNQSGKQSIFAVTPDGKKNWKLTTSDIDEGWHDWSPDGDWLLFDSRDPATGRYDIFLMNYVTKELTKVTGSSNLKYHQAPVFVSVK